jgi:hypothetical protein
MATLSAAPQAQKNHDLAGLSVVRLEGIEPSTCGLKGRCSLAPRRLPLTTELQAQELLSAHCRRRRRARGSSDLDRRVDLVEQLRAVGDLVVLAQVAVGLLARFAVERHVERDQPCPVEIPAAGARLRPFGA